MNQRKTFDFTSYSAEVLLKSILFPQKCFNISRIHHYAGQNIHFTITNPMNSSARFNIDKTANVPTCIDIAVCCNLGVILYAELDARMPRVQLLGKIDGDVNPETC